MKPGWESILETVHSVLGEEGARCLAEGVERVLGRRMPVVLLLGPYSSGKTSLAVRLLQEAGMQIPDSFSVGAAPETFMTQSLELPWCILQDTPGLGSGRPEELEELRAWALESDLVLLCLPPSGWQATLADLEGILKTGGSQSVLCALVQTRADEAGPDVEVAPVEWEAALAVRREDACAALSARQIRSLSGPTLAVACRPYGLPDFKTGWDGVPGLLRFLEALPGFRPVLTELTMSRCVADQAFRLSARARADLAEGLDLRDQAQDQKEKLSEAVATVDRFCGDRENHLRTALQREAEAVVRAGVFDEKSVTERMVELARDWWCETESLAIQMAENLEVEMEKLFRSLSRPPAPAIPPSGAERKAQFKSGVDQIERLWPKIAKLVSRMQTLRMGIPVSDLRQSWDKLMSGGPDDVRGKADRWLQKHPREARFQLGLEQVVTVMPDVLALLSAAAQEGGLSKDYVRQRLRGLLERVVPVFVGGEEPGDAPTLKGLCAAIKGPLAEQAAELSERLAGMEASVMSAEAICQALRQADISAKALLAVEYEQACGALGTVPG